jgi:hypothetical protein
VTRQEKEGGREGGREGKERRGEEKWKSGKVEKWKRISMRKVGKESTGSKNM